MEECPFYKRKRVFDEFARSVNDFFLHFWKNAIFLGGGPVGLTLEGLKKWQFQKIIKDPKKEKSKKKKRRK